MSAIGDLRTALTKALQSINGLRTSAFIPEQLNPPIAVVLPPDVTYDIALARGADRYSFTVLVIVGRVDERSAQARLDAYGDGSGTTSIKAAIEADPTLDGAAMSCRVTDLRNYRSLAVGEVSYLSAEFVVEVIA